MAILKATAFKERQGLNKTTRKRRRMNAPGWSDRNWLILLWTAALVLIAPRFMLGPYSVVGMLGDIGNYSVPYQIAAARPDADGGWIASAPMGAFLRELGLFSPGQFLLYSLFPGWIANALNWLLLTAAGAISTFLAARHLLGLAPYAAAFAGGLSAIAITNGNHGYSVIALMPLVLVAIDNFSRSPGIRPAVILICATILFAGWVPARYIALYPAVIFLIFSLAFAEGAWRHRISGALIAITALYLLRYPDLAEFFSAAANSDRDTTVMRRDFGTLLLNGVTFVFEYLDPRLLLEFRPLPQTNPITVSFMFAFAGLFLIRGNPAFRRLVITLTLLVLLQFILPVIMQITLFDILEKPGIYFHQKLWRPCFPLLFLAAGAGLQACVSRLTGKLPSTERWAVLLPLAAVLLIGTVQAAGAGARSWLVDGSYVALYEDHRIAALKRELSGQNLPGRAVYLGRPNSLLAAYGIETPLGRRNWLPERQALLLRGTGLFSAPEPGSISFIDLYHQNITMNPEDLPSARSGNRPLTFLALSAVQNVILRGSIDRDYLSAVPPLPASDWHALSTRDRIILSARVNLGGPSPCTVYRLETVLERVRAVSRTTSASGPQEAVDIALSMSPADHVTEAVVEGADGGATEYGLPERLESRYAPENGYRITVETAAPAFLVISEIFDGGWRYEIDGKVTDTIPANGAFTGLPVPAGLHELRFYRARN
jgi:hypothetical protein